MNTFQKPQETVEEFLQKFEINRRTAGYTADEHDEVLINILERVLRKDILRAIYNLPMLPETFEAWKTVATRFDQRAICWRELYPRDSERRPFLPPQQRQPYVPWQNPQNPPHQGGAQTFPGMGQPMDIDQRRQNGECFNCGKKGHIARGCRMPKKNTAQIHEIMEREPSPKLMGEAKKKRVEELRALLATKKDNSPEILELLKMAEDFQRHHTTVPLVRQRSFQILLLPTHFMYYQLRRMERTSTKRMNLRDWYSQDWIQRQFQRE